MTAKWRRGFLVIALASIGFWTGQRTYFWATPEKPTGERIALEQRVADVNADTEGGLLMLGFAAPPDMDPVDYGRCLAQAENDAWTKAGVSFSELFGTNDERMPAYERLNVLSKELRAKCLNGGEPMPLSEEGYPLGNKLHTSPRDWNDVAGTRLDALLLERFKKAIRAPSRMTKIRSPNLAWPNQAFQEFATINATLTSRARENWVNGMRQKATLTWSELSHAWSHVSGDQLIMAMFAVRYQTEVLLSVASAVRAQPQHATTNDWEALIEVTREAETHATAFDRTIEYEWLFIRSNVSDAQSAIQKYEPWWNRVRLAFFFDKDATLNDAASQLLRGYQDAASAAAGNVKAEKPPDARRCKGFPLIDVSLRSICYWLGRNGASQTFLTNDSNFASYGTRIADLRNLAAATRLTLEARRQGIAPGKVSADWVRNAPADMRDVFTGEPFEYNPERKVLRVLLRAPSTALGMAGETYELPL